MSKKIQLKNGLKVLFLESHKSPVISVQMWVKTGSADESEKIAGISHFIEHLVFKGTKKFKVGEIAKTVEKNAGELNAYTSFDQTVFYVTISKNFYSTALEVISQMMGYPTFDEQEIDNEREVVIEEIKRGNDSLGRRASQLLFSNMYKKHNYKRPVIGYEEIIKKVSPKEIKKYYFSRYVPRNMFLVVAGDFKTSEMQNEVKKYFENFVDYKLQKIKRTTEPINKSSRVLVEKSEFKQSIAYLSWPIPSVKHKDIAALDLLTFILGQGDSSRLVQKLRLEKPLCNTVGSFAYTLQDSGVLAASMSLDNQNLVEALSEMGEALLHAVTVEPTPDEMHKAVLNMASNEIYSLETVDSIARKSGSYEFYLGDHEYYKKYLKQIYQLKPKDILKVAKKYINPKTICVSYITDGDKKAAEVEIKKFIKNLDNSFKNPKRAVNKKNLLSKNVGPSEAASLGKSARLGKGVRVSKKTKAFKPEKIKLHFASKSPSSKTEKIKLDNGVNIYFREQKDMPIVSAKVGFLGGVRSEPADMLGLVNLFGKTWPGETQHKNEAEINYIIDKNAAGISPFSGRNSVGLGMDYISGRDSEMIDLFFEILATPKFSAQILEREKQITGNQIKSRNDNPAQLCILNFHKEMFKNHPYAKDMLGTEESLKKIGKEHLESYFNHAIQSQNMHVAVVGDFNKNQWIKEIEKASKRLRNEPIRSHEFLREVATKESIVRQALKKEQTHILLGYTGLTVNDPDRFVLDVISAILSGQGGRLFLELRDKKSLAYSVSPMSMLGIEKGYFGGYIGCSPEKTDTAIKMLKDEFEKLTKVKIGIEELSRAQNYLIGSHDIELQRKGSICNSILFDEIYGIDSNEGLNVADKYLSVTSEDIMRVAKKIFSAPDVISIVGPD